MYLNCNGDGVGVLISSQVMLVISVLDEMQNHEPPSPLFSKMEFLESSLRDHGEGREWRKTDSLFFFWQLREVGRVLGN